MRFLRTLLTGGLINLEGARMGDPTAFRSSRRLTFFIITFEAVVLVAVTYLRSQHPPGHDELNFLETGLRMLGSGGNPKAFLHGSFLRVERET